MSEQAREPDTFTHKHVRLFGRRVHRMALSSAYGLTEADLEYAFERGLGCVLYTRQSGASVTRTALRKLAQRGRDKLVVLTGPSLGYFGGSMRSAVESALRELGTDYLDVLMAFWLGRTSLLRPAVVEEMEKLRAEGKVRALGCSIHDRARAGELAEDSPLELFMLRYNAAHPGAERDVFPRLERRHPAVLGYTSTAWRKLLRAPRGWKGPVPDAGDCYRFSLSSPHVDMVLAGPSNRAELDANLAALERGPLSAEELAWMREFGRVVHG